MAFLGVSYPTGAPEEDRAEMESATAMLAELLQTHHEAYTVAWSGRRPYPYRMDLRHPDRRQISEPFPAQVLADPAAAKRAMLAVRKRAAGGIAPRPTAALSSAPPSAG
jgi:hypothetical protein